MPAFSARKFFAETVSVTGGAAISLAALLQAAGWGKTPGTNNAIGTDASMDSFLGGRVLITPATAILYIGHDTYVRNAAGAGPPRVYAGAPIASGATLELLSWADPDSVWVYSVGTQSVAIVFAGV